jgi:hypothetical protein
MHVLDSISPHNDALECRVNISDTLNIASLFRHEWRKLLSSARKHFKKWYRTDYERHKRITLIKYYYLWISGGIDMICSTSKQDVIGSYIPTTSLSLFLCL